MHPVGAPDLHGVAELRARSFSTARNSSNPASNSREACATCSAWAVSTMSLEVKP